MPLQRPRTPEQIDRDKCLATLIELSAMSFASMSPERQAEYRQAQRRSWAIGELMLEHPEITLAQATKRVDEAMKEG
jgi:hypothetical protein